jgi:S-adenosylmethionine/arginine decarboxylase-like enzyme
MTLGDHTFLCLYAVRGEIPKDKCAKLVDKIISAIGMHPIFKPKIWQYKDKSVGYIYTQPIYESMIYVDVWPKHDGAYLTVCSCKPFSAEKVVVVIEKAGLTVKNSQYIQAGLDE